MRKTNLFYLEDNTSNFLTFSNYGEFLTGVCLSTNHKIWQSSFLCLNLPFNKEVEITKINNGNFNPDMPGYNNIGTWDQTTQSGEAEEATLTYLCTLENFKIFLMDYYENKLAWLRDEYDANNKKQENLDSLSYLLEAISLFFNIKLNEQNENNEDYIQYFGDIVEHDYNGSYNDSMCIVDFNRMKPFKIEYQDDINLTCYELTSPLWNWNASELINLNSSSNTELTKYCVICDNYDVNGGTYNSKNFISYKSDSFDNSIIDDNVTKLEFNCIIPLFDIKDDDISEYNTIVDERNLSSDDPYSMIPYGIWFASENKNDVYPITLYKNSDNISQSWSLVICSKFSPYPYGVKINDEFKSEDKLVEKYTYAELLANHSKLLEEYNDLSNNFKLLLNKVNSLNDSVNNIQQLYPQLSNINIIDQVEEKLRNTEAKFQDEIENLKIDFNNHMEQLKWKAINKYGED